MNFAARASETVAPRRKWTRSVERGRRSRGLRDLHARISRARSSSERARDSIGLPADSHAMVVVPAHEAVAMPAVSMPPAMVAIAPVAVVVAVMMAIAPIPVAVTVAITAVCVRVAVAVLVSISRLVLRARRRDADRSCHEQCGQKKLRACPHLGSPHV